jgi:hypothetical protein
VKADITTRITPADSEYAAVVDKRFNKRFAAHPEYVCRVTSTEQVVDAVRHAVSERRRLVVTSGGHCLEGFVSDPDVKVIIDVSPMKRLYHDAERAAIAVEAGVTVGEAFKTLFEQWGTVIPLGEYPGIGVGGHVVGGAFGFLCRQLGLAADHLHGVEVVTVGDDGRANAVIATREESDVNRELWWAHTGGGGGNFGIVTRYWFRSPGASTSSPAVLLPRAPETVTTFTAAWDWSRLDEPTFLRLLENYGTWCERNSDADSPNASLFTLIECHRRQFGRIIVRGVSTAGPAAKRQLDDFIADLSAGCSGPDTLDLAEMAWPSFALNPFPDLFTFPPGGVRIKATDALLKKRLTERQIRVAYKHLTSADEDVMGGMLGLATYGGRVNTVPSDATAACQRSAIIDLACSAGWLDAGEDERNLKWVRRFYRDLFAESGGAPVPGEAYDGVMINHPDTDLADAAINRSGVPWHTLYYQNNYPRLQRVKARWDPLNVFHHSLSVRVDFGAARSTSG